ILTAEISIFFICCLRQNAGVASRSLHLPRPRSMSSSDVSFLFDLDGTLVDSVYQHVLAWQEALHAAGIELSVWRIHRKIGMSGGLFTEMLLRETPIELLRYLTDARIPWAIATSGRMGSAKYNLDALRVDPSQVPVVTRDDVRHAKPDPDLFLAAASRLGADIESAVIIGDSIWDMLAARRARGLGVGLLSGGYGQDELERSGAVRVYEDPADL